MIGLSRTSISERPHRMTWQNPGPAIPDGDGDFTHTWIDCVPPHTDVKISPATAADLERVVSGTVLAANTYIVAGPYHPQIKTDSRGLYNGRIFNVTGAADPEERHVETIAVCVEIFP